MYKLLLLAAFATLAPVVQPNRDLIDVVSGAVHQALMPPTPVQGEPGSREPLGYVVDTTSSWEALRRRSNLRAEEIRSAMLGNLAAVGTDRASVLNCRDDRLAPDCTFRQQVRVVRVAEVRRVSEDEYRVWVNVLTPPPVTGRLRTIGTSGYTQEYRVTRDASKRFRTFELMSTAVS